MEGSAGLPLEASTGKAKKPLLICLPPLPSLKRRGSGASLADGKLYCSWLESLLQRMCACHMKEFLPRVANFGSINFWNWNACSRKGNRTSLNWQRGGAEESHKFQTTNSSFYHELSQKIFWSKLFLRTKENCQLFVCGRAVVPFTAGDSKLQPPFSFHGMSRGSCFTGEGTKDPYSNSQKSLRQALPVCHPNKAHAWRSAHWLQRPLGIIVGVFCTIRGRTKSTVYAGTRFPCC